MSDRSPRFDAALKDLGERYATSGAFIAPGDIQVIASRHSETPEERATLVAWLTMQTSDL